MGPKTYECAEIQTKLDQTNVESEKDLLQNNLSLNKNDYDRISSDNKSPSVAKFSSAFPYWHERAAFQRSAFGRSTAGNDVVATIIISLFSFFPCFFPPFFPFFFLLKTQWINRFNIITLSKRL